MKKLQKVIILGDPGLDGATALSLALADPNLEVLAALACAGNVSAEQATRNMQAVLARLDPPRWPRLGVAPVVDYDVDGRFWHGANGMVGLELPSAPPLNAPSSDKLLIELARKFPGEISLLNMGPCTVLAQALDREPALVDLLQNVVVVGGAWRDPGTILPGVEFHFHCDPQAARRVIHAGFRLQLVTLDATRSLVVSPAMMTGWNELSALGEFMRELLPPALRLAEMSHGIEGVAMDDVGALLALVRPDGCKMRSIPVDIETQGEITKGMSIFDTRRNNHGGKANINVILQIESAVFEQYFNDLIRH
ncbi:MAG: nucleoside hydrolase [Planctomycetota bacterium]|jgi:purine nucleosidase|nr:nucleoside hydrolase [Planctomycetota bacterium]